MQLAEQTLVEESSIRVFKGEREQDRPAASEGEEDEYEVERGGVPELGLE